MYGFLNKSISKVSDCGQNMRTTEDMSNDPDYFFLGAPSLYDRSDHAEMSHQVKKKVALRLVYGTGKYNSFVGVFYVKRRESPTVRGTPCLAYG